MAGLLYDYASPSYIAYKYKLYAKMNVRYPRVIRRTYQTSNFTLCFLDMKSLIISAKVLFDIGVHRFKEGHSSD